jgi:hypothetical protein
MTASWWGPIGALLVLFVVAFHMGRRISQAKATIRRFNRMSAHVEDDMAIADWARHTMLTVTRATGLIYGISLADLRTGSPAHRTDLVWTDPVCIQVWTGTDGTIQRFREEIKEGDTGG